MSDDAEMTPAHRAEAYEVEAAHVLDRLTRRAVADMPPSELAEKFVELIVQAAVERMTAALEHERAQSPMSDNP